MSHSPLITPTPKDIEYFYKEDLQNNQDFHRMKFMLEDYLFYIVNPYQTPVEKQLNWNVFAKALKETSQALITFRRRLHMERSKPNVTFIDPEQKDVSSLDYGIDTSKV